MANTRKPAANMSKVRLAGAQTKESFRPHLSPATRPTLPPKPLRTHASESSTNGAKDPEMGGMKDPETAAVLAGLRG